MLMPDRKMLARHKPICSEQHFCKNHLKALYIKAKSTCPGKERQTRKTSFPARWREVERELLWMFPFIFTEHDGYEGLQGSWRGTSGVSKVVSCSSCSWEGSCWALPMPCLCIGQCPAQAKVWSVTFSHHGHYPHMRLSSLTFLFLNLWTFYFPWRV